MSVRLIEVAFAVAGLLALLPLLCAVALLVRMESLGPITVRSEFYRRDGRRTETYLFRTTFLYGQKTGQLTRSGCWLRRTCLDEMPKLVNLLRGDITLLDLM
jgi:lipopolysaccharide/colanic/teichoic acid biosynthesis glycosyltransferase